MTTLILCALALLSNIELFQYLGSWLALVSLLAMCLIITLIQFCPYKHPAQRRLEAIAIENTRLQRANGFG